jgi:hypothetical protein
MFRPRRMARIGRQMAREAMFKQVNPLLLEGNQAFNQGDFMRAAGIFEKLATGAIEREGMRAPIFCIQAGRSMLLAGQDKVGIEWLRKGLQMLAEQQRFRQLTNFGRIVVADLRKRGINDYAEQIDLWLTQIIPGFSPLQSSADPEKQAKKEDIDLPLQCPHCGAPVHPGEVDWVDGKTVECSYCGNMLRGE